MMDVKTTQGTAPEPSDGELLTLAETIELLGISKQTLYRMMAREEIKGIKVGRQWRFRRTDLTAFLQRGPEATALITAPTDQLDTEMAFFAGELQRLGSTSPLATPNGIQPDESAVEMAERKIKKLVDQIIVLAITSHASDIHLEPDRQALNLRYRIDGVLTRIRALPREVHASVLQRMKMMGDLNTEETRVPQDGRLHIRHEHRDYDIRMNVLPTIYGENAVMRILDQASVLITLDNVGMLPDDLERLRRLCRNNQGMLLITGPTGSGKTTTLYGCLNDINRPEIKILTVEDPVEYALPGITQVMVNRKMNLTFPVILRAFLRQDPDVIMAGEVRDLDTAQILVQASLTGHLVFSTMHTSSAIGAMFRLAEMGVEPFLITASLQGVMAQRLVRKLCDRCKQPESLAPAMREHIRQLARDGGYTLPDDATFYRAVGCDQCAGRGYRGRTGLYEVMECTPPIREAFLAKELAADLTALAVADGMHTLVADGIRKAAAGISTIEEVLRVAAAP